MQLLLLLLSSAPLTCSPTSCCPDTTSPQQQRCVPGFGQCCSPAGLPLRRKTVCEPSSDPCTLPATCDGHSITCPAHIPVPDGTPCSLTPQRLAASPMSALDPMPHLYPSRAAAAVQAATVTTAAAHGLEHHECHRCYHGKCTRIVVLHEGQRTGSNPEDGREIVRVHRGRAAHPEGGSEAEDADGSGYGGVGRGLQGYSRIEQPAWMYCK